MHKQWREHFILSFMDRLWVSIMTILFPRLSQLKHVNEKKLFIKQMGQIFIVIVICLAQFFIVGKNWINPFLYMKICVLVHGNSSRTTKQVINFLLLLLNLHWETNFGNFYIFLTTFDGKIKCGKNTTFYLYIFFKILCNVVKKNFEGKSLKCGKNFTHRFLIVFSQC